MPFYTTKKEERKEKNKDNIDSKNFLVQKDKKNYYLIKVN